MFTNYSYYRMILIIGLLIPGPVFSAVTTAQDYLEEARILIDKGDNDAAVIQLKNALLLEPDNGAGYLMLGKMYYDTGNAVEAGKMIERARELDLDRNEWLVPLAEVYVFLGRNDEVISLLSAEGDYPERLQAEILQLLGQAYFGKQQYSVADEKFTRALQLQPEMTWALLGKARIEYKNRNNSSANGLVDRVLAVEPDNTLAWTLKGEILRGSAQY